MKIKRLVEEVSVKNTSVIDFHSHILPNADHGSDSLITSQKQLEIISASGTTIAVATPHFYPMRHSLQGFTDRRKASLNRLLSGENKSTRQLISLAIGAEVYVYPGIENMENIEELCIAGTNTVLLEMPTQTWNDELLGTVMKIRERCNVVMAHIDRYPAGEAAKLLKLGFKVQLNTDSLMSGIKRRKLTELVESGVVVAFGSDLHGCKEKSYESFIAVRELLGNQYYEVMEKTNEYLCGATLYTV